jgi:hypothetical protein
MAIMAKSFKADLDERIDRAVLATAFNLLTSGRSDNEIISIMLELGWDRDRSEQTLEYLRAFLPKESNDNGALLAGAVLAVLGLTLTVFYFGDSFSVMPAVGWARWLFALGYATLPVVGFTALTILFSGIFATIFPSN